MERRILHRLIKSGDAKSGVRAIDQKLLRLWISALQSELFNQVAAQRIESIDRLIDGDLAWKHENGACFALESAETEQPRAASFEISPTGPLLGYRMTLPSKKALEIEENVFREHQLSPGDFRVEGRLRVKGARRPLRVGPKDIELAAGVDEFGPHITFAFTLPPGSFATIFLRECMKNDD
jgi:tRNA pseudouridine13 synthase